MSYYTEREGILVSREGNISLRHAGQLRQIKHAWPAPPAKATDTDPSHWCVVFTDESTAIIGRPIMNAAHMRRLYECPASVVFPPED